MKVCKSAYNEVKELIKQKRNQVETLAKTLLVKETVGLDELTEIFGKRDVVEDENIIKYIKEYKTKENENN